MGQEKNENDTISSEISVIDILTKGRAIAGYIKSKWKLIVIFCIIGSIFGLAYSLFIKPKYNAVCSFVLDEGDGSSLGQYAGLASLAGIDLANGGGGIFKGDNILELYKSRSMLEKTLLTESDFNGTKEKLIDRYIKFNNLLERWQNKDDIQSINFNGDPATFNRKQDSLITNITETFNKKYLDVEKPDKKLAIIRVSFIANDELFAKSFTNALVENVNEFYVQTKTEKSSKNVNILQQQVDSVKNVLNSSINGVAASYDLAPNANPTLSILRVPSQKKQIDVQAATAVYIEMIKNLEISKISLMQQMPLIQIIDQPVLPLDNNHVSKTKGIIIGTISGLFIAVFGLLTVRLFRVVLNSTL